jgi:hypothetical protein
VSNSDRSVAIASAAIALMALVATIWDGVETRHHNRLSVAPRLDFYSVHSTSMDHPDNYIAIENKGFGPAIIKGFHITVNGARYTALGRKNMTALVKHLGLYTRGVAFSSPEMDDTFKPSEFSKLLQIDPNKTTPALMKSFNDASGRMKLEVEYESLYGERFKTKADLENH